MAQMQQADVQRCEHEWRTHVHGSDVQAPCPICRLAANLRQSCGIGRGLYDAWVRAAQKAYLELTGGA
jgi:hypothetical protein